MIICFHWLNSTHLNYPFLCRLTQLCLRLVPRREFSRLMMMKRTFGKKKRSTLQHKPSPVTGRYTALIVGALCIMFSEFLSLLLLMQMFCLFLGLVVHSHPRAQQLVRLLIGQQLLAQGPLSKSQTQILRRRRILKMNWILSQAWPKAMQPRVRNICFSFAVTVLHFVQET